MNAGAYGSEMKDIVFSSKIIDEEGNIKDISLKDHQFKYRKSIFSDKKYIILESTFKLKKGKKAEIEKKIEEYQALRKEKQPYNMPSAGSTFKRGDEFIASKLIDECGLKGTKIGGAAVSEKHAGFIVNTGNASSKDILDLIKLVQNTVFEKTGKKIELEIEVVR